MKTENRCCVLKNGIKMFVCDSDDSLSRIIDGAECRDIGGISFVRFLSDSRELRVQLEDDELDDNMEIVFDFFYKERHSGDVVSNKKESRYIFLTINVGLNSEFLIYLIMMDYFLDLKSENEIERRYRKYFEVKNKTID